MALPDPKQQANAPKSFDETLRALQEIGSFLEVDEETIQLPVKVLAAALPPGALKGPVPPQAAETPVLITIKDLFFKLSKGKVTVTVGDVLEVLPPEIVSSAPNVQQTQEVKLPLPAVVAAVDPNIMREKMAARTHKANLSNLPDPFSSLRGALDNFAKQGGTAQAPVPPVAVPPVAVPPVLPADAQPKVMAPQPAIMPPIPPAAVPPKALPPQPAVPPQPVPPAAVPPKLPAPAAAPQAPVLQPPPVTRPAPAPVSVAQPAAAPVPVAPIPPPPAPVTPPPAPTTTGTAFQHPPVAAAAPTPSAPPSAPAEPAPAVKLPEPPAPVAAHPEPESAAKASEPAREPVAAQTAAVPPAVEAAAAPKPRRPARERVQLPPEQELDYLEPEALGGVNLNTAGVEQILTLPGVTPLLAQTIVEYREKNGPFKSVFDLINVPRLGRGTFRKLTGMPFSETHLHRRRKLAMLLRIPASKVGDLPEVAAAIVRVPGLAGCVISDSDGLLLTEGGASGFASAMSAVVPKMFRQMFECMAVVNVGNVKSASICIEDRMFTIIASDLVSLTVVHETSKLTKAQIVMVHKIAEELTWVLSHRAYVGKPA